MRWHSGGLSISLETSDRGSPVEAGLGRLTSRVEQRPATDGFASQCVAGGGRLNRFPNDGLTPSDQQCAACQENGGDYSGNDERLSRSHERDGCWLANAELLLRANPTDRARSARLP
jgi:hypothetical protein